MTQRSMVLWLALAFVARPGPAAAGDPGDGQAKEVVVVMSDFAFEVSDSVLTVGVPYRFVVKNVGKVAHEMAVVPHGAKNAGRAMLRVRRNEGRVGSTVEREFTFTEAGEFDLSCYLPTHYANGMVLPVRVESAP